MNRYQWNRHQILERLAQHEEQLTLAEVGLSNLRKQRHDLYQLLNVTTPMMSILPVDVLVEVFYSLRDDDDDDEAPVLRHAAKHPSQFLIGSVCRAWRDIAWSTPGLWNKINIVLSSKNFEIQASLVAEWLMRSGTCPLTWNIKLAYSKNQWNPPVDFFSTILQTSHRWKSFEFVEPSMNFALALYDKATNVAFPILKRLSICGSLKGATWTFIHPPQLETLHLHTFRTYWDMEINWSILTELEVTSDLKGVAAQLPALDSLKMLVVTLVASSPPVPPVNSPHHLSCLTNLHISGGTSIVGPFLALLKVPALETLTVEMTVAAAHYPWDHDFMKMAKQSSFRLTNLFLGITVQLHNENEELGLKGRVLRVLSEIPSIEKFTFNCEFHNHFTLANNFVRHMYPSSSDPSLSVHLPNLCYFEYRGPIDVELDVLYCMIEYKLNSLQNRMKPASILSSNGTPISPQKFDLQLVYPNINWYQDQDPNDFHAFYTKLSQFDADKLSVKLEWDRPEVFEDEN